jgi:hypothetical protein
VTCTLKHQHTGSDHIWRGVWTCNGYEIRACLDLGAAERLTRIRAGIEEPGTVSVPWLPEWMLGLWIVFVGVAR